MALTRRELLVGCAGLIGAGLFTACDYRPKTWEERLIEEGRKVEANIARFGIKNNDWNPLVDLGQLTEEQKLKLGLNPPDNGFFVEESVAGIASVNFVLATKDSEGRDNFTKLWVPRSRINHVTPVEDENPQIKPVFDLARFITSKNWQFSITVHTDLTGYLNTPDALKAVALLGNPASLKFSR